VDDAGRQEVAKLCQEILAPLVRSDGGEMHLVEVNAEEVRIHLSGTCAGCPGVAFTRDQLIVPIIRTAAPKARVVITTGCRVPEGAERL
jgi:Fe-S cluster biogenesis protein NfuA